MTSLTLCTWNTNGPIGGTDKLRYLSGIGFDVASLQECEAAPHNGQYNAVSRTAGIGRGGNVAILSPHGLAVVEDSPECTVSAFVEGPFGRFLFIAAWIKPVLGDKSSLRYVRRLFPIFDWAASTAGALPFAIAGDFNCNASFARGRGQEFNRIATSWGSNYNISSLWHRYNNLRLGEGEQPTWSSKMRSGTPDYMIDYVFAPASWELRSVWIGEHCGSDHKPVVAELSTATGAGTARVNVANAVQPHQATTGVSKKDDKNREWWRFWQQ
ncbi:MAG: endonuclease/exonuclease/phosphatase family protein [Pseudomonadota bacterium]